MKGILWVLFISCLMGSPASSLLAQPSPTELPDSNAVISDTAWVLVNEDSEGRTYFAQDQTISPPLVTVDFSLSLCQSWILKQDSLVKQGKMSRKVFDKLTNARILGLKPEQITSVGVVGQYKWSTPESPSHRYFNWQDGFNLNPSELGEWEREIQFPIFLKKWVPKNNGEPEELAVAPLVFKIMIETVDGQRYWTCHYRLDFEEDGGNWNSVLDFDIDDHGQLYGKSKIHLR